MKIKQYFLAIFLAFLLLTAVGEELPDLAAVKHHLSVYHDSGEYYRQIDAVVKEAAYYLQFRLNQNQRLEKPTKLAIVLDIDETALSNYADMMHLDFGGSLEEINADINLAHDPAIPGIQALYHYALRNHVAIFFITGRHEEQRQATIKNLKNAGYDHWDALLMKPEEYHLFSAAPFKIAMRKKIIEAGYDIVVNIGDQLSDLDGGYADMRFKLPNPYYRVN